MKTMDVRETPPTSSAATAETEPAVIAAIDSGAGQPPRHGDSGPERGCPLSRRNRLLVGVAGIGLGYAAYHLARRRG
jgi:hypothetical protein